MNMPTTILRPRGAVALLLLLMGCPIRTEHKVETTHKIEAHIVIDVRKIQEEAGTIESEVRGQGEVPKASPDPSMKTGALLARPDRPYFVAAPPRTFWSIFDVSTRAQAAEEFDDRAAIARRKARSSEVSTALDQGCFGENNRGYVELLPCEAVEEAADKARLQVLAADENLDRKIIYTALSLRQGLEADQADAIGQIYAGEIRKILSSGQNFQTPADEKLYEEFLASDLGRKFDKPEPGVWLRVP